MAVSDSHGSRQVILSAVRILAERNSVGLPGSHWAFLGNQRLRADMQTVKLAPPRTRIAHWFAWWDASVVCFDINGKDGSIIHDFHEPIPAEYHGAFDAVMNLGTTEHVANSQRAVFESIHKMVKPGGVIGHSVPAVGGCQGHGVWKYSDEWFDWLVGACGYDYTHRWNQEVPHNHPGKHHYCNVVMQASEIFGAPFCDGVEWRDPVRA